MKIVNVRMISEKLLGGDYRLSIDIPVWPLAKFVWKDDTSSMKKEISEHKVNPVYQESKFEETLLMVAISNRNYPSTKALLGLFCSLYLNVHVT